ncbi:MAG: MBL fold metallo-hydrolase [Alphaproteobacteria bacterium]|nr:MAG: MBL fold metallo-hydrolase [Alphaproteobacteria bacterium]
MKLTFLGAVGTVTGSRYLIEHGNQKLLVDCGLFQGFKQLRLRNWASLPVDPSTIDKVILTHAHIDHSGYLPLLVRNGFAGPILATPPTTALCGILLPDSGHLHERDAEFANRHGHSRHRPALPLYTQADAERALEQFVDVGFDERHDLGTGFAVRFKVAGHILGAAMVLMEADGKTVLFSGDLGRPGAPTMPDPAIIEEADYLVIESTYGDRKHSVEDPEKLLADIITRTAARGGTILIPSFAVGRAQTLLYHIHRLKQSNRIPDLPVFLDSPMAIDVSEIFCRFPGSHRLTAQEARRACGSATFTRDSDASKALDRSRIPKIIISASGMATGGRVLHHLKRYAPDSRNTILFAGFQAGGTRGAAIVNGAREVKIHGEYVPIAAEVDNLDMLSAHADAEEIMAWLGHFKRPPRMTFVTHGEPEASDALRHRIQEELGWPCLVPEYKDTIPLD